ncbi:MAG: SAM-dependent methyltransferase [Gammaproteobacteria bacterium]|nr:SAM-dependent methyltransferase [Gammaproteobacteria bacterium]
MAVISSPVSESEISVDTLRMRLAERIRQEGPLRFDQYMEQALYAPEYGYYERTHPIFGTSGDFVTAPGLGDLLAHCVARFCDFSREELGNGAIAEYGPGNGMLAHDVLDALKERPDDYWLLERSSELRKRQAETLDGRSTSLRWSDRLPKAFEGIVLANEFLDALPARCFEVTDEGIHERMVAVRDGDEFCWELGTPASLGLDWLIAELEEAPAAGYCSEWRHDALRAWLDELDESLQRGVVLIIDYGYPRREYYHPQRVAGTLRCHADHQAHSDPFRQPGHEDISVDVDFTAVAELATERGFDILMFTSQAGFLLEYGLLEAADSSADEATWLAQRGQIETLTHPDHMGERFRVLALSRDFPVELPHRVCPDHRNRL